MTNIKEELMRSLQQHGIVCHGIVVTLFIHSGNLTDQIKEADLIWLSQEAFDDNLGDMLEKVPILAIRLLISFFQIGTILDRKFL